LFAFDKFFNSALQVQTDIYDLFIFCDYDYMMDD